MVTGDPARAARGSQARKAQPFLTRRDLLGYAFISPWVVGFLIFTLGPFIASFVVSLTEWELVAPPRFVGLGNYSRMILRDSRFRTSLWNTAYYSVFSVPGRQIVGLVLAVILNQKIRGIAVFRTIFYLPSITVGVANAFLWMLLLNPRIGAVNQILGWFGIDGPNWLSSITWAMPALIVMSLWSVGQIMIIYLAGLQGVPVHLYEAAEMDGAGRWSKFWHVTLPLITPAMFFNLVMGVIGSFQVFTAAYLMTAGGPADRTLFYTLHLYREAFQNFRMGYAAALAWVLFAIVLILTIAQLVVSRRWVYYEYSPTRRGPI